MKYFLVLGLVILTFCSPKNKEVTEIFVSTSGDDENVGSSKAQFATLERAMVELAKLAGKKPVTIWIDEGTYYLKKTIEFGSGLSGTPENPIIISSLPGAKVTIKGSQRLDNLTWKPYKEGVYVTAVSKELDFDQLFINGQRQVRARFPNYDYKNPLRDGKGYLAVTGGTDHRYDDWFTYNPSEFSNKVWSNPTTAIIHAFQSHNWGNMQYQISGINKEEHKIQLGKGGWQLQRSHGIGAKGKKASMFYIDNLFEELDVTEEWFLDKENHLLYYFPKAGMDLNKVTVEVPVLEDLIKIKGSAENPVTNITIKGLDFTQSKFTFMEPYEPMSRGDWSIHRGGVVFLEGTENCTIEDCSFNYLGGNGVFMSGYNRNNRIKSCQFVNLGESAVCFVGFPSAVRFNQTWDDKQIDGKNWNDMRKNMDLKPGPKTPDYPKNCRVENNIMHDFGEFGKQTAGIVISKSHKITVAHNTIYNCPRAGICINDGTWGGHVVEFNDIWETVRETGEHGPFNSWGRERQWLGGGGSDKEFIKELTKLDAIDATILRSNRIANYRKSISAGNWTIDLDDGSSFYEIYNNLNLGSTIKLRDGMSRKVYNNITVSAVPLGWHVWPKDSEDEIYKNIFVISGSIPGKEQPTNHFTRPIKLPSDTPWSTNYDYNLYWNVNFHENTNILQGQTLKEWQDNGYDQHSKVLEPLFVDPLNGDFSVSEQSPALKLGFKNFPMDEFGHQMTRSLPNGGEFKDEVLVSLKADSRVTNNGVIHYTLNGMEPNLDSPIYSGALKIDQTTLLKSRTFTKKGIPVGFVNEVKFEKVAKLIRPSWLSSLIAGEYIGNTSDEPEKALELEVIGAMLVNIADDPDLIDASGGYNSGCFIKSIDPKKGRMWLDSGLTSNYIIQKINGEEVQEIGDLKRLMKKYKGSKVTINAVRDYTENKFTISFP